MDSDKRYHMTADEFRRIGRSVIDWIADYYENIEGYPVLSQVKPGDIRAELPPLPPQQGESFDQVLEDIERIILPGVTHWQSPNFFAYFPANTSGPSILGELLSAGLGVQGMLWQTSPACTELETHVLDWLVEMMDLPEKYRSTSTGGGVIQDSASSASLCALLAGRERATAYASNKDGIHERLTAYASTQAHSSIEKAVKIAGMGSSNLRLIETDETYAMRPEALAGQLVEDRQNGYTPCFVCATVGTTSSNAIDPLERIGPICQAEGVWLHVDAAMAGTAAICPEFRHLLRGLDYADSYCFNPHKWMFTNFDCDCFYVAERKSLIDTLSILPEYLRNKSSETGQVIDYRDWQIPLGRRFRALKLWFVIRHYGIDGLQYHIREHVRLAQEFAGWIEQHPDFEIAGHAPLNLVCFRHNNGDTFNRELLDRLNQSGELYLTHTTLDEKFTLRLCVGQTHTGRRHIERAWTQIQQTAKALEYSE
ncbi:MAG: pyridoxal-dependent decarboxylase [Chloroflexota bacterium]|nr:pyridoxal-dependent decarboxylase [Chloroflexota bacterium]